MVLATLRSFGRSRPKAVTTVLSVVGYALVLLAFYGPLPVPALSDATVVLFGDLIVLVNTVGLTALLAGAWFIKRGEVRKHRAAMLTAFGLILLFLVLYLWKVGGGFEKSIVFQEGQFLYAYRGVVELVYFAMLAVHIILSVVAVPVVLHAVVLGLTRTPAELRDSLHPKVGRIAVAAWSLSLFLGILTYILLNHVYAWEVRGALPLLLLLRPARSIGRREGVRAGGEGDDGEDGE